MMPMKATLIKRECKMLKRVERHIVTKTDKNYEAIKEICHKSKNLYNYANYILRKSFFETNKLPNEYDLVKILTAQNQNDYRSLPAQTAQKTIKLLFKNWKSFFRAVKAYQQDKFKFKERPRIPKFKPRSNQGFYMTVFTNQQIKSKNNLINFPKFSNLKPITTKVSSIKQVRLIPDTACFIVEIVYEKDIRQIEIKQGSIAAIDLGLNGFVTFLDNQGNQPFIINGKGAKSYNQFYNKRKANLRSQLPKNIFSSNELRRLELIRNLFMQNFLHQSSSIVIKALIERKIETLVIGLNEDWKQKISLGKITNQNFVSIPYRKLVDQLIYKCEEIGIKVILTEEAYTSKIDHFIAEEMKHHDEYAGKRIHRGLFRSSLNFVIQSDVNGALGIMRKVFPEKALALANLIRNRGVAFTPIIINPISLSAVNHSRLATNNTNAF